MKKSQFIELVAERAEMSRSAAARVVDAIFNSAGGAISDAVRTAGHLSIPGFGKFTSKTRAAREGRNPRTGTVIQIPERTTVAFAPGKGFRDTMAGGGAAGAGTGTATKSRTAGSARKAAGGATKTAAASTAAAGGATATKSATAKKSAGAAKTAAPAKTAAKSTGSATKSTAKKTGGTKSAT